MMNTRHGSEFDFSERSSDMRMPEPPECRQQELNVMWPRTRDVFFSLLFSAMAIDLGLKAHMVWQEGLDGYTTFYAAGSACAVAVPPFSGPFAVRVMA